jgi:hypothetical protein
VYYLLKALLAVALGTSLGLAATYFSLAKGLGFGAVRAGPWTAWPKSGSTEADPYARAAIARTGEVPLGLAEGVSFIAASDSSGAPLSGRCTYLVGGAIPPARYWTLSVNSPKGFLIDNPAKRYGVTSAEIYRQMGAPFQIAVSRTAHAGNWLPVGTNEPVTLVLRLYDSSVSAATAALDSQTMPSIVREGCA